MKKIKIPDLSDLVVTAFHTGDFTLAEIAEKAVDDTYLELQKSILSGQNSVVSCKSGKRIYVWSKSLKSNGIQKSCFWYNESGILEALSDVQINNKTELIREEEKGVELEIL